MKIDELDKNMKSSNENENLRKKKSLMKQYLDESFLDTDAGAFSL